MTSWLTPLLYSPSPLCQSTPLFSPASQTVAPHAEPLLLRDLLRGCELSLSNILAIGILFRVCVASSGWFSYPRQILVIHVDLNVFLQASVIKNRQFNRMCVPCVVTLQPVAPPRHYGDKVASRPTCLVLFTYRGEWGKLCKFLLRLFSREENWDEGEISGCLLSWNWNGTFVA